MTTSSVPSLKKIYNNAATGHQVEKVTKQMSEHNSEHHHEHHHDHHGEKHLEVIVHYPAAKKPFEEKHASRKEALSTLKTMLLKAFGLPEGEVDGKTYTYTLYHHKTPLENLSETLGQIAGHAETLVLKLSQQVTQG